MQIITNFCQSSVSISSGIGASIFALLHAVLNCANLSELRLSNSPTRRVCIVPKCSITPGEVIRALIFATPPNTFSSPSIFLNIWICSIPFRNGIIPVLGPTSGLIANAALSVSYAFTQKSIKSAIPKSSGISLARAGSIVVLPSSLLIFSPLLFIASR